jgi:hypothetical protein
VNRDQIHTAIAQERRRIADLIDGLDDAQLATDSLCAGWDIKTVAAHLLTPLVEGTVRPTLLGLLRGSLSRVVDERARRGARLPAAEIAATLRERADHQYFYPPPHAPIPLGLGFQPDPRLAATALDFLTTPMSLGLMPWGRLRGLRLRAIDIDRSWGRGREIRGPAAELMLAVFGRSAVLDALDGPGLPVLQRRIRGG